MYKAVETFCASNEAVWDSIPTFVAVYVQFSDKVAVLDQLIETQDRSTLGVKDVKDQEREQTAGLAHKIASALRVLAKETANKSLLAHLHFRESALYQGSSASTIQCLNRVKDAAVQYAATLIADFGIAQTQIDDLVQRVDQMQVTFGSTRNAIINRGKATGQIRERIAEIDDLLRRELDLLVEFIKNDHPDFALGYKLAREVVDIHGKKHKAGKED